MHNQEFHANGQLAYQETFAAVPAGQEGDYKNIIIRPDGAQVVRVGVNEKFFSNGQLAWRLIYDEKGSVKEAGKFFRKDGSVIQY